MPAPITHIVLALAVLPFLPEKDQGAFIRGTSFPDIRYCCKSLSREMTHHNNIQWHDVQQEPSPFRAGVLFHSLIDRLNNPFLDEAYAQLTVPDPHYKGYLLKIFQDILLYDLVKDWQPIVHYFDFIDTEALGYSLSEAEIRSWHQKLQIYCCHKPTMETVIGILGESAMAKRAKEVGTFALQTLLAEPTLQNPIKNFYEQFLIKVKLNVLV